MCKCVWAVHVVSEEVEWSGRMCVYARARAKDVDSENINIFEWQLHASNIEHSRNTLAKFNFPITLRQFISSKLNRVNVCLFVSTFFSARNIIVVFHVTKKFIYMLTRVGMAKISGNRKQCSIGCYRISIYGTRNCVEFGYLKNTIQQKAQFSFDFGSHWILKWLQWNGLVTNFLFVEIN